MENRIEISTQQALGAGHAWPSAVSPSGLQACDLKDEALPPGVADDPLGDLSPEPAGPRLSTYVAKRQIKAAEYRDRALEASALAAASPLDRVREKHEESAARWRSLAALSESDPSARAAPALRQHRP